MSHILVCLDDTDNLESRGTGELASLLADQLAERGWGKGSFVTRHQLLVHPDIPYTSHNSAMCFAATLQEDCPVERFIDHAGQFLARESAPGSDPGLGVALLDGLEDPGALIAFGRAAKERVLSKEEAYGLAGELGIHLSEHGGSGQGVIGALAGLGLRLGGNDGRLKGQLHFGRPGEIRSLALLRAHPLVDAVRSLEGEELEEGDEVELGEKIKTVLLEGCSVLLLERTGREDGVRWRTCSRQRLKGY
jgi:hypothetical protein